jgi:sulfide dehydrogenase cytochrome subunit
MARHASILLAGLLAAQGAAHAQAVGGDLATRSLAATCAACHGTEGRAVIGAGMPSLRGFDRQHLQSQLMAFRDGTRPATVMHQIAKGYTPEQIEQLAAYFAALP